MNLKKTCAIATLCFATITSIGCTSQGKPVSDYTNLKLTINYTQAFNLAPAQKSVEKIYILTRDLTGKDNSNKLKNYLVYNLRTNPNCIITENANEADILIYSTITSLTTNNEQGYGGTIAGGLGGLVTGAIANSNSGHYDNWGYYHDSSSASNWYPLLFAGIGAGIGYAIDSATAVKNVKLQESIEVKQCVNGECQSYFTEMSVLGEQMNLNEEEALGTIIAHSARGLSELIKH